MNKKMMMKKKETKSPAKSELEKTSRLGKSQGIPLHFRFKVKRNLSRRQERNGNPKMR